MTRSKDSPEGVGAQEKIVLFFFCNPFSLPHCLDLLLSSCFFDSSQEMFNDERILYFDVCPRFFYCYCWDLAIGLLLRSLVPPTFAKNVALPSF